MGEEKDEIKKLIAEFDIPKPATKGTKAGNKTAKNAAAKTTGGPTQALLSSPAKPTTSGMYCIYIYTYMQVHVFLI